MIADSFFGEPSISRSTNLGSWGFDPDGRPPPPQPGCSPELPEQVNDDATDPAQLSNGAEIGSLLTIKDKAADKRDNKADYRRFEQAPKSLRNHPLSVPPTRM
jgi:hypothetical protein